MSRREPQGQRGFSLVEVLVTVLVLAIGLLGMFGLMSRALVAEMESYQRSQALTLIKDMEARLRANAGLFDAGFRSVHAQASAPSVFGTGSPVNCSQAAGGAMAEVCEWSAALQGVSTRGADAAAAARGAMVGARGCLVAVEPPRSGALGEFFIVVVWQGFAGSADPAAGTVGQQCANGVDFSGGRRRAAYTRVLIPKLLG